MAKERTGTLRWSPTKKTWLARIPVFVESDGVRMRKKMLVDLGTDDEAMAREKLKREVGKSLAGEHLTREGARAAVTVADYAERWLKLREELKIAAASYERRYLERVWLPAIGATALDKVGTARIREVLNDAARGKIKPWARKHGKTAARYGHQSLKHMHGTLVRLMRAAWKDELIADNKAARVDVPQLEEVTKARAILSDVEIAQLVSHADVDAEIKVLVLISRTVGGLRGGDLNAMSWTAFSPGFTTCTFVRRKTRKKRPLPETHAVPEVVRAFLKAWWERWQCPTSGPVFPSRRGERAGLAKQGSNSYADRLRRELLRAGVNRHELHHDTETTRKVDFHSTRRAFCTASVKSGASDRETMKLGGWSSPALITRYDEKLDVRELPAEAALPALDADWTKTLAKRSKVSRSKIHDPASFSERDTGLEPVTSSLGSLRSTN